MRTRSIVGMVAAAMIVAAVGTRLIHAQQGGAKATLTTQDYIDIQQLYARYNLAIDTGDAEGWASTFTPDGVFNNSTRGHDALVQFIHNWRDKLNGANRRHWNTNLVITPAPGGASGSVYLLLLDIGVRPAVAGTTGMYEDALVKTPQGWRFKTRVVHGDPAPKPAQ